MSQATAEPRGTQIVDVERIDDLVGRRNVDLVRDQPMSFAMHGVCGVGVGCLDEAEDLALVGIQPIVDGAIEDDSASTPSARRA